MTRRARPTPHVGEPGSAAPAPLGQPRRVTWLEVVADVRTIALVGTGRSTSLVFHATRQSWPAGGGRAIVVTGCCIDGGLELWTYDQLLAETAKHVADAALARRSALRVWRHPLRLYDPWPADIRVIELK